MGAMTAEAAALRAEFERAVLKEMARTGADKFEGDVVVKAFSGRVARTTAYRWLRETIASGKPAQALTKTIKRATAARAKRSEDPARDAAAEIVEKHMPARVTVADVTPLPPLKVVDELREAMADVKRVRAYAKTPEGGVRNARLILQSCEVLRRCLETAMRLVEGMHSIDRLERFHGLIIDEISKLAPETAEALTIKLGQLSSEWGG